MCPASGLTTPWRGRWRLDLAAACVSDRRSLESVLVVEVKGTVADLARERLDGGKWAVDFAAHGLTPWLAVADVIGQGQLTDLPRSWGVLSVSADGVVVESRQPSQAVDSDYHQPGDDVTRAYRALSEVLTAQALPTLFGRDRSSALSALSDAGVDRPWRRWASSGGHVTPPRSCDDEDVGANIL